ncbi:MAG TPA: hypothetical protein VEG39_05540 [Clostridia bacterium]|nr:hypothetical protein [Clostridia bacterium]
MGNIRINPIPALTPMNSSSLGYSSNGDNKNDNQSNYSGQTFQDIFKQMLEKQA